MIPRPIDRIKRRFELNINRVKSLLVVYGLLSTAFKEKMNITQNEDVLRSAVVLMHATLEDMLREVIRVTSPTTNAGFVKNLALETDGTLKGAKDQFRMSDLINMRGKTISDVIDESIKGHLSRRSFNHVNEVASALSQIGFESEPFATHFPLMELAMTRRHDIVHRSDRTDHSEKTHGTPTRIQKATVEGWLGATEAFGSALLHQLTTKNDAPENVTKEIQTDPLPPAATP